MISLAITAAILTACTAYGNNIVSEANPTPLKSESLIDIVNLVKENCSDPPLHYAIYKGDLSAVRKLILDGADMYAYDCKGYRAMDLAILGNQIEIIKTLLFFKFDVNSRTEKGDSVLHYCVVFGSVEVLTILIDAGAISVDVVNNKGETPLFLSVLHNKTEAYETLISYGADVNFMLPGMNTYIHQATRIGSIQTLLFFVAQKVPIDAVNELDETAMSIAVKADSPSFINLLLSQGASFSRRTKERWTYLHLAVRHGSMKALSTLCRHGLLIDAEDTDYITPLHIAVQMNRPDMVQLLIDHGAMLDRHIGKGVRDTYLHIAVHNKSLDALRVLLQNGLPADITNFSGHTPSLEAVFADYVDALAVLKSFGADLQRTWYENQLTLLHEASLAGSVKSIIWLVQNGHSVNETTAEHWTSLHYAAYYNKLESARVLLDLGICVNCEDTMLRTAMRLAQKREMILLLQSHGGRAFVYTFQSIKS